MPLQSTAGKGKGAKKKAKKSKSKLQAAPRSEVAADEKPLDEVARVTETAEDRSRVASSLTVEQQDGYARMLSMLQSTEEADRQTPGIASVQSR